MMPSVQIATILVPSISSAALFCQYLPNSIASTALHSLNGNNYTRKSYLNHVLESPANRRPARFLLLFV